MKSLIAFILLMVLPATTAAQKPPTLRQQLAAELTGKTLTTKVVLLNMFASDRRPGVWFYVVTNVQPDGGVAFGRSGVFMIDQGGPIPRSSTCAADTVGDIPGTMCRVEIGQAITVTSIGLGNDHLSIGYWPVERMQASYASYDWGSGNIVNGATYAPYGGRAPRSTYDPSVPEDIINVILGKDWQKAMSVEQVIEAVGNALVIERVERGRELDRAYADLRRQAADALAARSSAPPERRIENTERLRGLLLGLIENRTAYERLGKGSTAQEIANYMARIRELDGEMERLRR